MPRFEFLSLMGEIQGAIQRSIDLVSFGLQAADRLEIESLEIPGVRFRVGPAQNLAMEIEQAREEFRTWVLSNGLRDCVDAIGPSLEWARKTCFLWTREGEVTELEEDKLRLSVQLSGEEWNVHMINEASVFDRLGLRKQLDHLQDKYHLPHPELSEAILSIRDARNCLTHRKGMVGPEDLKDGSEGGLLVKWIKLELQARGEEGARVLELPAEVQGGEIVSVRYVNVSKKFALGDRILFSPEEFVEISMTFLLFAMEIENAIKALQKSRLIST